MAGDVGTAAVIDLGEDRSVPDLPVRPRWNRRRWLVAAVLAACLALAGSAPPRSGLVPLFRLPLATGGTFAFAPGTVVVFDRGAFSGYALPSGTRLWRTPVQADIDDVTYVKGTATVVAIGYAQFTTVGLDYRTGRILWHQPGTFVAGLLPERHLAVLAPPASTSLSPPASASAAPAQLMGVDLDSGRVIWSRAMPPGADELPSFPDARDAWYAVKEADGTLDVIDGGTGAPVARWPGALPPNSDNAVGAPLASLVGRHLLSAEPDGSGTAVVSRDVMTAAVAWRTRLASPPQAEAPELGVPRIASRCGALVCLAGSGIVALDPDSGAMRWQTAQWQGVDELPGGLVLLSRTDQGLIDALVARPGTLSPVLDLTGWQRIADPTVGTLVVAHTARDQRVWFAAVDLPAGGLRPLGSDRGIVVSQCWSSGGYLGCRDVHSGLRLWRYAPS